MSQWQPVPLSEICEVVGGGTPRRNVSAYFGGDIPWATPTDVTALDLPAISKTRHTLTADGLRDSSARLLPAGAVLLTSRATLGFTAIAQVPMCTNQGFANFVCGPRVLPGYLAAWLPSQRAEMERLAGHTTFKEVSKSNLKRLEIPLPPLEEQRRIVDILNRANGIRRLRREALDKTRQLIPALFVAMFGDPATNPKGLKKVTLADLIEEGPQNGLYRPSSDYGEGVPIVRIDSFYDGQLTQLGNMRRIGLDQKTIAKYQLREFDILINRVNSRPYLGKSAIVPTLSEPTVFESNMMRFAVQRARVDPHYLITALQQRHLREQLLARAKDAINQSSINQTDVRSVAVLLPALDLQREFVARATDVQATITQQERMAEASEQLIAALMAQLFDGG